MPIERPEYQLFFELDLPFDEGASTSLGAEEIRLRSETAREALEGETDLRWVEEYARLRDGGWDWRVAAYIAWASSPRTSRKPKTQEELATQHLGLTSDRAIATWRKKNAAIDEMVAVLQSAPLWDARADVFAALIENAQDADYKTHNDRKLFLELTGDYVPSAKLLTMLKKGTLDKGDLADMSDEELAMTKARLLEMVDAIDEGKDE